MNLHPLAGKPAPAEMLLDLSRLENDYHANRHDPDDPKQAVIFGTSGHRGSSRDGTFTENHVLAITQAICDYRLSHNIAGPLFMGRDTHALSAVAQRTALEVLAANGVETFIQSNDGATPTPVISRAILVHNRRQRELQADGIILTPSHNPPEDGGLKYNPPHGGPAPTNITRWIQDQANALLRDRLRSVKRMSFATAIKASTTHTKDFVPSYVKDLYDVVDLDAVRASDLQLVVDPLGGASLAYWERIQEVCGLNITIVNSKTDPTFRFMPLDHDGKIRIDCSSPYAMAGLLKHRNRYALAVANDPDADRHGIVTPGAGLMPPNHFLAVAIRYLLGNRPVWPRKAAVGKTIVSSSLIDRVVRDSGHALAEMPVGFKWFAPGLYDSSLCFAGEESAGATFLCNDGKVWTTDKDGILLALLAAEMTARTGKDPAAHYHEVTKSFGRSHYTRLDAAATPEEKLLLQNLSPESVKATHLAGDSIVVRLNRAPANDEPIGGLKVATKTGWFAARPSGTENIYKIYAESFISESHLDIIVAEAKQIVADALSIGKGSTHLSESIRQAPAAHERGRI